MNTTTLTLEQAIELAISYYHEGKIDESKTVCDKILEVQPDNQGVLNLYRIIVNQKRHPLKSSDFFTQNDLRYLQYDIGDYTYGKPRVVSWKQGTTLKIGRCCSIADEVIILLGGEHHANWVTTYPFNAVFQFTESHHSPPPHINQRVM